MGSDTGALIPAGGRQPAVAGGHIPPPQNNEAEELLLASLIDAPVNVAEAMALVTFEDFYRENILDHYKNPRNYGRLDPAHAHAHADIWLSDVTAGYGSRPALEHVDLAIEPGTLLAVVGPNGAGKSTLLKVMAGLLAPWSGRVEVLRAPAGREARRIAYVPQAELVDWQFPVTVRDVVTMGRYPALGPLRRPGPADRRAVDAAL